MNKIHGLILITCILSCYSCYNEGHADNNNSINYGLNCNKTARFINCDSIKLSPVSISCFLDTMLVDGFDFPYGNIDGKGSYTSITDGKIYDSWKISTTFAEIYSLGIHPGVDYNGIGGGNTDLGQPVFSIGKGQVVAAEDYGAPWGGVVVVKHKYLENGKITLCFSLYAHLEDIQVSANDYVGRRQQVGVIGTGDGSYSAHLHFEIRNAEMKDYQPTYWPSSDAKDADWIKAHYFDPETFLKNHRKITCPLLEDKIIIAIKNQYKLYYFVKGQLIKEYDIALSQNPIGHKQKQGDYKLPEGEYYICEKQKGPFYGDFSDYLGPRTLRISYPNSYDAEAGFSTGLISKNERDIIVEQNRKKEIPNRNTKLGGSIVIHGWINDWVADGSQNLTWGCISMLNNDLLGFFEIIEVQTKIVISE